MTNDEVLGRVGKNRELLLNIKKRKLEYFGHVMRNPEKYKILHLTMQWNIYGKREPGRFVGAFRGCETYVIGLVFPHWNGSEEQ